MGDVQKAKRRPRRLARHAGRPRRDDGAARGARDTHGPLVASRRGAGQAPQPGLLVDARGRVSWLARQILSAGRARRLGSELVRSRRPRIPAAESGLGEGGFQLGTELLFSQAAWEIGQRGGQLIAAPRATGGHRRWSMAACLAAIMGGCFVASTNRRSYDDDAFAGRSWLVSPEGEILLETSADSPFLNAEVDLSAVARARQTYPRNLVLPGATTEI